MTTTTPEFWSHTCPVEGAISTAQGEPCNYCDKTPALFPVLAADVFGVSADPHYREAIAALEQAQKALDKLAKGVA